MVIRHSIAMPHDASQPTASFEPAQCPSAHRQTGTSGEELNEQAAESETQKEPTRHLAHSPTRQPAYSPTRLLAYSPPGPLAHFLKLLAVVFVVSFYVGSAHRTVGHQKDFFSQWTLARLAVEGEGAGIYNPTLQRRVARAYTTPGKLDFRSDFYDRVGVSPYPPIMALLYAPLGWLTPEKAQWCMVQLAVLLAVATAWAIARMTDGRISFSTALLAECCFPGFFYNVALGQNAAITLALFAVGLMALAGGRQKSSGAAWGVLAYKIHWVAVVGWIPFALGRNKAYLGLAVSLGVLASAATLVFGWDVWPAWLVRVRAIAAFYGENPIELGMACDLRAAAQRYLPAAVAPAVGWALLWVVGGVSWWRFRRAADRDTAGPAACVLLFGAGLAAPYMMYYDVTVFVLPLLLLWSHRAIMNRAQVTLLAFLTLAYYAALPLMDHWPQRWQGPPWATLAVLGLWGVSLWVAHTCRSAERTELASLAEDQT